MAQKTHKSARCVEGRVTRPEINLPFFLVIKWHMNKTPEGHVDLTRPDDLLDLALQQIGAMRVPDQRYVKGLPPQLGIPCLKCTHRELAEAYAPTDGNFVVHKASCDLLVKQSTREPYRIDPIILNLLIQQNEYEEEHVTHVAGVRTPGIALFMALRQPEGAAIMCYLVDGTHRAVAALRAGRDFLAYVLVPKEALKCLSHMDGKPNPQFIGQRSDALFDGRTVIPLR